MLRHLTRGLREKTQIRNPKQQYPTESLLYSVNPSPENLTLDSSLRVTTLRSTSTTAPFFMSSRRRGYLQSAKNKGVYDAGGGFLETIDGSDRFIISVNTIGSFLSYGFEQEYSGNKIVTAQAILYNPGLFTPPPRITFTSSVYPLKPEYSEELIKGLVSIRFTINNRQILIPANEISTATIFNASFDTNTLFNKNPLVSSGNTYNLSSIRVGGNTSFLGYSAYTQINTNKASNIKWLTEQKTQYQLSKV